VGTKEHGWAQENHAKFTRACAARGSLLGQFEVTEIRPDEIPGRGSALGALEERRAKSNPDAVVASGVHPTALPAIQWRTVSFQFEVTPTSKHSTLPF